MKRIKIIYIALSILPIGFSSALLALYFHARLILGYYPTYNNPDPKDLDIFSIYEPIIDFVGSIWIISILIWAIILVYIILKNRTKINWKIVIMSVIAQIIAIGLFLSEIINWYAD